MTPAERDSNRSGSGDAERDPEAAGIRNDVHGRTHIGGHGGRVELTAEDRALMRGYLTGVERQVRQQRSIALRYAIGAGLLMIAALLFGSAWLALPVYGLLVTWLWLRHRAFRRRTRALADLFAKLENRLP